MGSGGLPPPPSGEALRCMVYSLTGHADKINEAGLGHPQCPVVFDSNEVLGEVTARATQATQAANDAVEEAYKLLEKSVDEKCPTMTTLEDPQILVQEHLQKIVLDNTNHGLIPQQALDIIAFQTLFEKHEAFDAVVKKSGTLLKRCKYAIGAHFTLKKLSRIKGAEANSRSEIAEAACQRLNDKGIMVSAPLRKALEAFKKRK